MGCQIVLETSGPYTSNETISGKVIHNLEPSETVKGIHCKLIGIEETKWGDCENQYDERTGNIRTGYIQYKGSNTFSVIDNSIDLPSICPESKSDRCEHPFTFVLPLRFPSTYENNFGFIGYYIEARVDKDNNRIDVGTIDVEIKSPINFNHIRNQLRMDPIVYQTDEMISTCCYPSDPVIMDMVLEKEAFLIGEMIKVKLDVNNMSDEDILKVTLNLTMVIESKATKPKVKTKYCEKTLASAESAGVARNRQHIYKFESFHIDQSAFVPNLYGSKLFRQKFILKAEAVLPGQNKTLGVEADVSVGHIPLVALQTGYSSNQNVPRRVVSPSASNRPIGFNLFNRPTISASAPPSESSPSAPWVPSAMNSGQDNVDHLPPSYEEAVRATSSDPPKTSHAKMG